MSVPRYCKKCKEVFEGEQCPNQHPIFLYTKKIPDGLGNPAAAAVEALKTKAPPIRPRPKTTPKIDPEGEDPGNNPAAALLAGLRKKALNEKTRADPAPEAAPAPTPAEPEPKPERKPEPELSPPEQKEKPDSFGKSLLFSEVGLSVPAIPLEGDSESDAEEGSPQATDVVRQMQERRVASRVPPPGFKELAELQASQGRHYHSTLSLAAIACHSLGIFTLILLSLLPFSAEMTALMPSANAGHEARPAPRARGDGRGRHQGC
jgi:hypothetical protein